jgi:hypothetical protein
MSEIRLWANTKEQEKYENFAGTTNSLDSAVVSCSRSLYADAHHNKQLV